MKVLFSSIWLLQICFVLTIDQSTNQTVESNKNECLIAQAISESLLEDQALETSNAVLTMNGTTSVLPANDGQFHIHSKLNISKLTTVDCPSLENANSLSKSELIARLTAPCRYDRLERPLGPMVNGSNRIQIKARMYIYLLQNVGSTYQFNLQALLQLRYVDPRLAFESVAPQRQKSIQGEAELRDLIWVPHLFFANEQDSSVLGTFEKDILTTISPNGTIVLSTRIQASLFCWLQLKKFPFDEQYCTTTLESWMYNSSDLVLNWQTDSPINFSRNMQFTHYALDESWHNESLTNPLQCSMWHGGFTGNYSSISFTVHLVHSAGYYVMDYFIPSIIMVSISWVSFWLRADQTPARTTVNCSTMLSFITLSSSQLRSSSSFITILEIWFLGCCLFIFCSLIEFAFSNTIYRRTKSVQLKKVNSKSILKSTVAPKKFRPKSMNDSSSTLDCIQFTARPTIYTTSTSLDSSGILSRAPSSASLTLSIDNSITDSCGNTTPPAPTFATMTPQEISLWLDKKARFLFPVAFIIFNVFFWMFVLIL